MKAIIKEIPHIRRKKLLVNFEESDMDETPVTLIYDIKLKWCVRYKRNGFLTSVELRGIADKLDKYNNLLKRVK